MHYEPHDTTALLRLQAGKANAMNPAFLDGVERLFDEAERARATAVVMTGYERFFCAGLDLPTLLALDRPTMTKFIHRFDALMLRLFSAPYPVVAALNGHAIAGGCVLALQADYRIMAAGDAKIGLNEVQLGVGLPVGVLETLRCQVPPTTLLPVALEGRLVAAEEARALGLVHECAPAAELETRALAKARALGELPAEAFRQIKEGLRRPAVERIRAASTANEAWIATWFSESGQHRIRAAVESLARKGKG